MRTLFLLLACCLQIHAADLVVQIGTEKPLTVKMSDLELLPHQTVKAADHGGKEATWSGVPLYQVLQFAGVGFGDSLRGPALAQYVVVTATDGYKAVFALPELDLSGQRHQPALAVVFHPVGLVVDRRVALPAASTEPVEQGLDHFLI